MFFINVSAAPRTGAQLFGSILSREAKAGVTTSMVEIEHGQAGMKTSMKSKTGLWRPEKPC
jgi:hypothetical protein